jgi:hypothetical protein
VKWSKDDVGVVIKTDLLRLDVWRVDHVKGRWRWVLSVGDSGLDTADGYASTEGKAKIACIAVAREMLTEAVYRLRPR